VNLGTDHPAPQSVLPLQDDFRSGTFGRTNLATRKTANTRRGSRRPVARRKTVLLRLPTRVQPSCGIVTTSAVLRDNQAFAAALDYRGGRISSRRSRETSRGLANRLRLQPVDATMPPTRPNLVRFRTLPAHASRTPGTPGVQISRSDSRACLDLWISVT